MTSRTTPTLRPSRAPRLPAINALEQLMYANAAVFMGQLADPAGNPFEVAHHQQDWSALLADSKRVVLMAPRSHGKTTVGLIHALWVAWKHGRDPKTARPLEGPTGRCSTVLFSATLEQAEVLFSTLRDLIDANPGLFPPPQDQRQRRRTRSSRRHVRFANGADISIRAYRTSTRGLHPDLLLLDDVLNDANSLSRRQRDLTWKYFAGTLLPMSPGQIVIVGSAIHQDDLLHRLGPRPPIDAVHGFEWVRYKAIDEETGTALWESRHPYAELVAFREAEPTIFSREYQNEPRDDAASIFPYELTAQAVEAGRALTLVPEYNKDYGELIVLGADLARSEAAGADFTVMLVAAWTPATGLRRILAAERHKGLDLGAQIKLLVDLCRRYRVNTGSVEDNGFQSWLLDGLRPWPDVAEVIHGHTTGRDKVDPVDGVLGLKVKLLGHLWVIPSGDEASRRFARIWQAEMAAFGWTDGRLAGLGEHDDTVMACWFLELAIRRAQMLLAYPLDEEGSLEDLGFEPVRIGPDY